MSLTRSNSLDSRSSQLVRQIGHAVAVEAARELGNYARGGVRGAVRQAADMAAQGYRRMFSNKRRRTGSKRAQSSYGGGGGVYKPGVYLKPKGYRKKVTVKKYKKRYVKKSRVGVNPYRLHGWQCMWEFNDEYIPVGTPDHISIHSGVGSSSLLYVVSGCIWRALLRKRGIDVTTQDSSVPFTNYNMWIYYSLAADAGELSQNIGVGAAPSHDGMIALIRDTLCTITTTTAEQIRILRVELEITGHPRTVLMLMNAQLDIACTMNSRLQNRTLGQAAGDDQSTDVTNNPIRFQRWVTPGNAIHLKIGQPGVTGEIVPAKGGIVTHDDYPASSMRLQKGDVKKVVKYERGIMNPGAINRFALQFKKRMSLNFFLYRMNKFLREAVPGVTNPDDVYAEVFLGSNQFIQFDKVCSTGGQKISLGIDHQQSIGCRLFEGRRTPIDIKRFVA